MLRTNAISSKGDSSLELGKEGRSQRSESVFPTLASNSFPAHLPKLYGQGKEHLTQAQILALPLPGYVPSDRLLNFSKPICLRDLARD